MIKISGSMFRNPLLLGILGSIVTAATLLSQPSAPPINVYDGFEGPSLSNLWNTISIAPNSVRIQSSIVRAGHGALRIDLHSHDVFLTGRDGDADSERAPAFGQHGGRSRAGLEDDQRRSLDQPRGLRRR